MDEAVTTGTPLKELTDMSPRGRAALAAAGITTIEEACLRPDSELLSIFGFKQGSLDRLREWEKANAAPKLGAKVPESGSGGPSADTAPEVTGGYPYPYQYTRTTEAQWRDQLINFAIDTAGTLVREHKKIAPQSMDEAFAIAARCYRNIGLLEEFFNDPDLDNPFVPRRGGSHDAPQPRQRLVGGGPAPVSVRRIVAGAENLPERQASRELGRQRRVHAVPIATAILKPPPAADMSEEDADWNDDHVEDFAEQDY